MAADIENWPRSCRYFVPQLHDADYANSWRLNGTRYLDPNLRRDQPDVVCIDVGKTGPSIRKTFLSDQQLEDVLDCRTIGADASRVLFVSQKRRYFPHSHESFSFVDLTSHIWLQLLHHSMIPAFALEALHDNNGALCSHTSYCSDNEAHHDDHAFPPERVCAFHMCVKVGNWASEENFLYARHDFHTRTNLILVMGTGAEKQAERILSQFRGESVVQLFSVLLLLVTCWARTVEDFRWSADTGTQLLEQETGYTARKSSKDVPLELGQLTLGKGIPVIREAIDMALYGADRMEKTFTFLLEQLQTFHEVSETHTGQSQLTRLEKQLSDTIAFHQSQAVAQLSEIANLRRRAESQWTVVNALVSQHDNHLNMDIARDSREDSKLLRRIAFVTIIFLPATFLATFFSMTFFHTGDGGRLVVSKWIWLYVVFTVPLTIFLAHLYGWSWGPLRRLGLGFPGMVVPTESPRAVTPQELEGKSEEMRYAIEHGFLQGSAQPPLQSKLPYSGADINNEVPRHRGG